MAFAQPIEHVVIILKENHTFDNYFGTFPGADGDAALAHASDPPLVDPRHTHAAWLNRAATAVRDQYHEADIPDYFAYARQFTLCDTYFSSVAGPSTPNHLMLVAAASPVIDNPGVSLHPSGPVPVYDLDSLPAQLNQTGLSWRSYGEVAFCMIAALRHCPGNCPSERFAHDAEAGQLATVSWVFAPRGLSEHPRESIAAGMRWTVEQVEAIARGGLWPKTTVFITWDDWGGWYDHVDPPEVERWCDGTQFRDGSRVPCLVLGPYAKSGYISKARHSHLSLVRFCETRFGLPPLNERDAAADDMTDCFDFTQRPLPAPTVG